MRGRCLRKRFISDLYPCACIRRHPQAKNHGSSETFETRWIHAKRPTWLAIDCPSFKYTTMMSCSLASCIRCDHSSAQLMGPKQRQGDQNRTSAKIVLKTSTRLANVPRSRTNVLTVPGRAANSSCSMGGKTRLRCEESGATGLVACPSHGELTNEGKTTFSAMRSNCKV